MFTSRLQSIIVRRSRQELEAASHIYRMTGRGNEGGIDGCIPTCQHSFSSLIQFRANTQVPMYPQANLIETVFQVILNCVKLMTQTIRERQQLESRG